MSALPPVRWILLVSDRDETQELVQLMLDGLPDAARGYPQVNRYMNARLERYSSVQRALEQFDLRHRNFDEPALIVIDAAVRRVGNELAPGDETSVSDILRWMDGRGCGTPVLIASPASLERLDREVLRRPNVGLWDMRPEAEAFAQVLAGLLQPSGPQRITVMVGQKSARYCIEQGKRHHTFDRAYQHGPTFASLLKDAASLSPYDPSTRTLREDWQQQFGYYGKTLFQLLLYDGLGPRVHDVIGDVAAPNGTVDIRFEIDLGDPSKEGLFALPFEIANTGIDPESFLCARVPMARRISWHDDALTGSPPPASAAAQAPDHSLRALFVNAAISGTVTIVHGRTGKPVTQSLDHLENISDEQDLLKEFAKRPTARLSALTIISGRRMRGQKLIDHVREQLTAGGYDIFHFSGHSVTLDNDGGTFLIFPATRHEGVAVSIQHIADWVREGGCRLVVLSSCRGSSLRTAIETMRSGAQAVLGFRWDVDDDLCVDYFRSFYEAYLVKRRSLPEAYRDACRAFQRGAKGGRPLWASAVAVVRD